MKFICNNLKLKQRRRDLRRDQTDAEKILWQKLRNRQLYGMKFFRQYSVGPYILDFYCPKSKLAIELDGGQHAEDDQRDYDEHRSEYLEAHGIEVIRFWNNEVLRNIDGVLSRVAERVTPSIPLKLRGKSNPTRPPLKLRGGEEELPS